MKTVIILIEMIFLHCIADYYLQGILADMKQIDWWKKGAQIRRIEFSKSKYKFDYRPALLAHSIEWSFLITLPQFIIMWINEYASLYSVIWLLLFDLNVIFHYLIDDAKANKHKINLIEDQTLHFLQIIGTWIIWLIIIGY